MKKSKPAKLLLGVLGLATFASLVGTVSGTLAWYAYSTRATLSYSGTSVNNTVQLQIGIASPKEVLSVDQIRQIVTIEADENETLDDEGKQKYIDSYISMFEEFWNSVETVKWDSDSNYYYFAPIGSGLSSPIINAYLKSNGYATNCLIPVTSGAYSRGDVFNLKSAPTDAKPFIDGLSDKEFYSKIPFVFRAIRSNTTIANLYVEGSELWLTNAEVRASSDEDGDVYKAVRMFIDRPYYYEDDFIVNPSASAPGSTIVAGLLDINGDHYYDYDANGDEFIYGDYEFVGGIRPSYSGSNEIADINGTNKVGFDTFTARHRTGINYYENYDNCVFKTADYECLNSIAPIKDEVSGILRNKDIAHPTSVCKTGGADDHFLGRVDFTIYLEGWDHNVVDEEIEHMFDLGLTFEINKL